MAEVARAWPGDRLWGTSGDEEADSRAYVLSLAAAAECLADCAEGLQGLPGAPPEGCSDWLRFMSSTIRSRLLEVGAGTQ